VGTWNYEFEYRCGHGITGLNTTVDVELRVGIPVGTWNYGLEYRWGQGIISLNTAGDMELGVGIPVGTWNSLCYECCLLSG